MIVALISLGLRSVQWRDSESSNLIALAHVSGTAGQELPRIAILGGSVSNRLIDAVQFRSTPKNS